MFRMNNEFSMAAITILVSAILHIVVIVISTNDFLAPMLAGAVGWFLIGAGLQRGWRWLAHIAFLCAMIGGVVAMGYAMGQSGVVSYTFWGIVLADWIGAVLLFVALWRSPAARDTSP